MFDALPLRGPVVVTQGRGRELPVLSMGVPWRGRHEHRDVVASVASHSHWKATAWHQRGEDTQSKHECRPWATARPLATCHVVMWQRQLHGLVGHRPLAIACAVGSCHCPEKSIHTIINRQHHPHQHGTRARAALAVVRLVATAGPRTVGRSTRLTAAGGAIGP